MQEQCRRSIVLEFFGQYGFLIDELCRIDLIGKFEELLERVKPLKPCPDIIVHLLEFIKVLRKFRDVLQYCRRVAV